MGSVQFTASADPTQSPGGRADVSAIANGNLASGVFEDGVFEEGVFEEQTHGATGAVIFTSIETSEADQVQPGLQSGVQVQRVGWVVFIDGSDDVNFNRLITPEGITVSRSIDQAFQVATFRVYAPDSANTLGYGPTTQYLGSNIGGIRSIDIKLRHWLDDGSTFDVPVITDGVVDASRRVYGGVPVDELSVLDRGRRFANKKIERRFVAGSNVSRTRAVNLILSDMGVTSRNIRVGGKMKKQFEWAKEPGISAIQQIIETKGGHLVWDRHGVATIVYDAPERSRPDSRWTFTADDIVSQVGEARRTWWAVDSADDAYTFVSMRGSEQVKLDDGCRVSSLETGSVVDEPGRVVQGSEYVQSSGSTLNVVAASPPTSVTRSKVSEVVQITTTECGEIIGSVREVKSDHRKEVARFTLDTTDPALPIDTYRSCFVDEDSASGPGYDRQIPTHWRTERETASRSFDDDGYLVEERTETEGWYNPRAATKQRADASVAWDTATGVATYNGYVTGDGDGVIYSEDRFITTGLTVVTYERAGSYLSAKVTSEYAWVKRAGSEYLYGDGSTSSDIQERFRLHRETRETYELLDELRHLRITVETDVDGNVRSTSETVSGQAPAAPRKNDPAPVRSDFDSDADFSAALAADRFDLREIRAECSAPSSLLGWRLENELDEVARQHPENEQELRDEACRLIMQGMVKTARFSTMVNGRVDPGQWARVVVGQVVDETGLIVEHRLSGPMAGPILSDFTMAIYPDL